MTTSNIDEKIAQKEQELQRLKEKKQQREDEKVLIVGNAILEFAREDHLVAKMLLSAIDSKVKRKTDMRKINTLVKELKSIKATSWINHLDHACEHTHA